MKIIKQGVEIVLLHSILAIVYSTPFSGQKSVREKGFAMTRYDKDLRILKYICNFYFVVLFSL